jgi:alkylated DNA repair dioxygenase AlkB
MKPGHEFQAMNIEAVVGSRAKPVGTTESIYTHVADYLGDDEADELFMWLLGNVEWQTERLTMFGRSIRVPRLVAWYGDPGVRYRYSGIDHCAGGWPRALALVLAKIRRDFAPAANFALLNRYRSGSDSMGWHCDDEPEIADPVVSVSLGASRRLRLRNPAEPGTVGLDLGHGALLVHPRHCPHCIPKTRKPVTERINISFRTVIGGISRE